MNKVTLVSLLAVLLVPATNGFAQKGISQVAKNLNPVKLERAIAKSTMRLAPKVPGVYIPAGTTMGTLESRIALIAKKANIQLDKVQISIISNDPQILRQFQEQAGIPLFEEGHPLPYKEGIQVLQANQEKFAAARANGEYEEAWAKFIEERGYVDFAKGKSYGAPKDVAADVYNFYVRHIGTENLPRVQMEDLPEFEAVVCEIPVDGLYFIAPRPMDTQVDVSPEKFVVIHSLYSGKNTLMYRDSFEDMYRVIQ